MRLSNLSLRACALAVSLASLASVNAFAASKKVMVDVKASKLEWEGSKITGAKHHGEIAIKEGYATIDGNKIVDGKFTIDMNSITNLDLTDKAYNEKLVTHLKSEDFFDVGKFPTAELTIKSVETQKDGSMNLKGDLKIKNETKPLSFVATMADDKTASGTITIDRTEWNVRYGSGKFFKNLGDKVIADTISFKVNLKFSEALLAKK